MEKDARNERNGERKGEKDPRNRRIGEKRGEGWEGWEEWREETRRRL